MRLIYLPIAALLLISCMEKKEKHYPPPEIVVVNNPEKSPEKMAEKSKRDSIIAFAKQYLGTAYCYAGNNPKTGFDCSGFVNFVFEHFDIDLPRSSSQFKDLGTALKPEDFKKGDVLVFYGYRDSTSIGHVGIVYKADGMHSKFIHASSGSDYAVTISDLDSDMYTKRFYKCIDVLHLKQ